MAPSLQADDPGGAAACIADLCAALQSAAHAEETSHMAARAAVGARLLDMRLAQIEASLERIEGRLFEVERELVVLTRPSWPF